MAWLVIEGDGPKTRIGSHSIKHSHSDHKCAKEAAKSRIGGGSNGAEDARSYSKGSVIKDQINS